MYILKLNDMRSAHVEEMSNVCIAETKEQLVNYLNTEFVDHYIDSGYRKTFKKNGPLEWYNPPISDSESFVQIIGEEEFIQRKLQEYRDFISNIPRIY
mgnify:CR=1 FL=1